MIGRLFLILLFFSSLCLAQDINVHVEPEQGTTEEDYILSINIENYNSSSISNPSLHKSKEFITSSTGTTNTSSFINGVVSNKISFTFTLSPRDGLPTGEYKTPAGSIKVDGKEIKIPSKIITITKSSAKKGNSNRAIKINQFTDKEVAFVGEQITYTVQIISDQRFLGGNINDVRINGFWREKLGNQEKKVFRAGQNTITTFQEVLIPNKPGNLEIPSRKISAQISVPLGQHRRPSPFMNNSFFKGFSIFDRTSTVKEFTTQPVKIKVKELPANDIKGYIPVGQLSLKSKLDKSFLKRGQTLNMTISLNGFANVRPLKLEKPKTDKFKIYIEDSGTKTIYSKARVRFRKTFKVSFIPTISGKHDLPVFEINYFDPLDEKFKTLKTEKQKIDVIGNFDDRVQEPKEKEDINKTDLEAKELLRSNNSYKINPLYSIALILLAIFYKLYNSRRTQREENFIKETALDLAKNEIDKGEDISKVFKQYLLNKTGTNYSAKTIKEINSELIDKLAKEDQEIDNKLLDQLEIFNYRGQKKLPTEFLTSFKKFIEKLDSKLLLIFFIVLSFNNCTNSNNKELEIKAAKAEKLFQKKDYDEALDLYKEISHFVKNAKVHERIATISLEKKEIGRAIYHYKLASNYDDKCCIEQLEKIRAELKSKPMLVDKHDYLSNNSRSILLFIASLILSICLFSKSYINIHVYHSSIILTSFLVVYFLLSNLCNASSIYRIEKCLLKGKTRTFKEAIVVKDETIAFSEPNLDSQAIKMLSDGTELLAIENRENWILVNLGENRTGWIEDNNALVLQ